MPVRALRLLVPLAHLVLHEGQNPINARKGITTSSSQPVFQGHLMVRILLMPVRALRPKRAGHITEEKMWRSESY